MSRPLPSMMGTHPQPDPGPSGVAAAARRYLATERLCARIGELWMSQWARVQRVRVLPACSTCHRRVEVRIAHIHANPHLLEKESRAALLERSRWLVRRCPRTSRSSMCIIAHEPLDVCAPLPTWSGSFTSHLPLSTLTTLRHYTNQNVANMQQTVGGRNLRSMVDVNQTLCTCEGKCSRAGQNRNIDAVT